MHELMLIPVESIQLPSRKHAALASIAAQSYVIPTSMTAAGAHIFVDLMDEAATPSFAAFELEFMDGGDS
jgi:hypothetical protein